MLIEASELLKLYKNGKWKNNIVIFDSSWYLPNLKRNAFNEYQKQHIPNTLFFDIDEISNKKSNLPHMAPSIKQFNIHMENMGIKNNSCIIIYSKDGIGTSPRAWWTFKLFGHKKVYVLNGGLRAWLKIGGPTTSSLKTIYKKSSYSSNLNNKLICNYKDVLKASNIKSKINILDARSEARFKGIEEEPRPGLKKGHIPKSLNLPFNLLIDKKGYLIKKSKIKDLIKKLKINSKSEIITSCGSGVTACTIAFALKYIGINNYKVYDGSWSEWGSKKESKVEK